MIFRQLFDPKSSTYTYLLADHGQAVLIDPVLEQVRRDAALVRELGLMLVATLETHVHADHVTGAWHLRRACGSAIVLAAASGASGADRYVTQGDRVVFGERELEVRSTPGHTDGCLTFVLDDRSMAFTGDALLVRGAGRTDFQQGDAERLYDSVHHQIFTLPDDCLVYPAHDYAGRTSSSVGEEKRHNPRLGGTSGRDDFVGYMRNLGLPHPRLIDEAVPANLRVGAPEDDTVADDTPTWAPLAFTYAGIWEIQPEVLQERLGDVTVLDVRAPEELDGPLGRIRGSLSVPLDELAAAADRLDRSRPIVTVCRAGARSAQAAVILRKAGVADVANLAGGMLQWRALGLPADGGAEA